MKELNRHLGKIALAGAVAFGGYQVVQHEQGQQRELDFLRQRVELEEMKSEINEVRGCLVQAFLEGLATDEVLSDPAYLKYCNEFAKEIHGNLFKGGER